MSDDWKPVENAAITQKLRKPIHSFGVLVEEIRFREPLAGDVMRAGNPVKHLPGTTDLDLDEQKGFAMMARLSNIPLASLEKMNAADAIDCMWGIARFFIPEMIPLPAAISPKQDAPPGN